ncbi:S60 ribosomal protein L21 [Heterostelium album PN500]|uniref:S60 ribosomal protein L21 n=1 Tax=Heterostelium pallidum (strain ATCC 26659 / Pp 5 / PN500) TaxID=670386 RepID=D3BTW0_HETP5|nr:S60 ribosomal protein L21 [Heterostelium album PN500]EFA75146.1 S60 ribosomal protein L21 [Heterostelium album PN500]|eukprot:XP_020427280.1 S60 ribosomal protein L21 [Heterostelium album PN500]
MTHSYGQRSGTRHKFARGFRQHGLLKTTTFLRTFRLGDIVDIKASGNVHKGMPHKYYHGRTGRVWNVTPRAVGVIVNKRVGPRYIAKKIHVRIEHVRPSNSMAANKKAIEQRRQAFLAAIKARKAGQKVVLPVLPAQPKTGFFVNPRDSELQTITPLRYELLFILSNEFTSLSISSSLLAFCFSSIRSNQRKKVSKEKVIVVIFKCFGKTITTKIFENLLLFFIVCCFNKKTDLLNLTCIVYDKTQSRIDYFEQEPSFVSRQIIIKQNKDI